MKKFTFKSLATFLFLTLVSPLCFAIASPADQLQQVANNMLTQLKSNQSQLHKMSVIRKIVNQTLLPHVDLNNMSAHVVGNDWRTATAQQKTQFKTEFARLLTSTYAAALSSYHDDIVKFLPLRGNFSNQQSLTVYSNLIRPSGQNIPISYDVNRVANQWKVYDFSIEHVSMVQSYRSQFASVLAQGGMSALLSRMQNHNQSGQ